MQQKPERITKFWGKYRFLSNYYVLEHEIEYDGLRYNSTEAAYQASKTDDLKLRTIISKCKPAEAKMKAKKFILSPNWKENRIKVMKDVLRLKFDLDLHLRMQLLDTKDAILIEGNHWNDTFWGVCNGVGENQLGKALMELRKFYQKQE